MTGMAGLGPREISLLLYPEKSFRGKQVFKWIHRGASDFQEMTDLPQPLRDRLSQTYTLYETSVAGRSASADGTVKLTLRCGDSRHIECVVLTDREGRRTACLSSQAGCAMGCTFCKTGRMGFGRDLAAREMVEQYLTLHRLNGPISNIVFMGMGEPLANLENLRKAVEILGDPEGSHVGVRKITVSTCGMAEEIEEMARSGPPVRLAVSLVTADDALRNRLMPINRKYPLSRLKEALRVYTDRVGKRITLEYVLLPGVNDRREDIDKLTAFATGLPVAVNLIPWNPVEGLDFSVPTRDQITAFTDRLRDTGIPVTRRRRRGRGIGGACGQLAVFDHSPDPPDPGR